MKALRVAMVTETYPPEVNGVARTIGLMAEGLCRRGHAVQLVRPRQNGHDHPGAGELLARGLAIPRYPQLKMGLPAGAALSRAWSQERPDVVHIATEGPLGWSALAAAQKLEIPVATDFHTNFQTYSRHYGFAWLARPVMAYLRRFHNRAHCTMCLPRRWPRSSPPPAFAACASWGAAWIRRCSRRSAARASCAQAGAPARTRRSLCA
jgi:glycosyltransferase involved in cell wall biosynthesis